MKEFKSPSSSNIAGATFDPKTKELTIDFKHGGSYKYQKFTNKLWEQFNAATSKGSFFAAHIIKDRNRPRFKGVKINAEKEK